MEAALVQPDPEQPDSQQPDPGQLVGPEQPEGAEPSVETGQPGSSGDSSPSRRRWRIPNAPTEPGTVIMRRLPGETWSEWGDRARAWTKANMPYLRMLRVVNLQRMVLFAALMTYATIELGAQTLKLDPGPFAGPAAIEQEVGTALDIPYRDSYHANYPDCWPFQEQGRPAATSYLVVLFDGRPVRMTPEEFLARKRARDRSLAEEWVVGFCSKKLPAFDPTSIPLWTPADVRRQQRAARGSSAVPERSTASPDTSSS